MERKHGIAFSALYSKLMLDLTSSPLFDIRIFNHMSQGASLSSPQAEKTFQVVNMSVVGLGSFIICIKGSKCLRNETKMPVFWAAATLAPVFSLYMMTKYILCHCNISLGGHSIVDCLERLLAVMYIISVCGIAATVHSKHLNLPLPKVCQVFRCCGAKQQKVITTLSLWSIYCSFLCLLYSAPYQVLMVCANPHMYRLIIITVWCVIIGLIMIISIPFTVDQIFLANKDFRTTPK